MRKTLLGSLTSLLIPFAAYGANISYGAYQRRQSTYIGAHQPLPLADSQRHSFAERTFDPSAAELDISTGAAATELVIIDAAVPDKHILYRAAKPGVDIVEITSTESGLAQLTGVLSRYRNLSALHIVSHALHGELLLGNSRITAENVKGEIEAFAALNGALRDGGDLLLYGCDLAAGEAGEELLEIIKNNTHLDVAASSDKTGARDLTGDWDLEISTGNIEAELPFSDKALKDFSAVLAAANGTYNFSGFTDGGATLTSTDFIVSAKDSSGTPSVSVSIYGSAAFLDSGMVSVSNYFYVAADGVDTGSFELTGLAAAEYYTGEINLTNVRIVGILRDNSQITSTELDGSLATGDEDFIFGAGQLSNFAGVQLKAFKLYFDVTTRTPAGGGGGPFVGDAALFDFNSFTIANAQNPANSDANLTAAAGVTEPVSLGTIVDTVGEAVDVFDFTISDGGGNDGLSTLISQIVVNVSGTSTDAERGQVTWRLNGPDVSNVTGTYNAGADTITFSGLSINVAHGGNETYTVNAYYNNTSNLTEDHTVILSVDGDTNLTVGALGTQMGSTSAVNNGTGTTIDVVATQLVFSTQPAGSVSGAALTTQPVVAARDAAGNTDVDFTETVTLTEASAGSLTNNTQAATAGVATFTNLIYTATADQQSFTLTANDDDGSGSNLPTANANAVTSDVVATKLLFTTQPAPLSVISGAAASLTTVPVVSATDANDTVDTGYSTGITLQEVNGAGSATMSATGDTDGNGATVTITPSSGVSTFTGMQITYTASGGGSENFDLQASSGGLTTANSNQFTASSVPTVTDGNISISGATGTGGAYKIGDTVTATWNNTAGGDNNSGISGVTVDFSQFGGGAAVAASESSGTWTATYTITAGAIDATNRNVSVTATNGSGPTTTADTSNASVDNAAPTVTDGNISISGATGTGGAFKIGDTVTATWNNTAGGDNNSDTISSVTVDFSQFGGGGSVAASNSAGTWTATYTIVSGAIDNTNRNVSVTATDNAGNTTTTADTTNATADNVAPTVTDGNISISGASGTGGAYKTGDTVTATWNNTAGGDNNSDTISAVTVDFTQFGGGAAVAASNSSGTWTATYTIVAGAIDTTNRNVSVTATDNAGNTTTTADTTNATVDNITPTVGSVSVPANATYTTGQNLNFTVNYSENITVDTGGGTPRLVLTIGATTRYADYLSGSGTSALVYRYTVQAGDEDTNGIALNGTLDLNSGTQVDDAGNNASTTLNSVGSLIAVLVDAQAPTVSSVSVPADASYTTGQNLDFTVNTSENVTVNTGGGTPRLTLTIGAITRYASYLSGSGTSALVFRHTVQSGDLDTDGIAVAASLDTNSGTIRDAVSNDINTTLNSLGSTTGVLVDTVAPSGQSVSFDDGTINATEATAINFTFASAEVGAGYSYSISSSGGGTPVTGTGTVASANQQITGVNVSGLNDGTLTLSVVLTDTAGNSASAVTNTATLDKTAPSGHSVTLDDSSIIGAEATATSFTFASAEVGAGYSYSISSSGGGTPVTGSGTIASASQQISGINVSTLVDGTLTLSVTLTDTAGNSASAVTDTTSMDASAPLLNSSTPADNASGVAYNTDLTLNFSENVSAGAGSISLYDATDDSLVENHTAASVAIVGANVTVDLTTNLQANRSYYVHISNNAFSDVGGNNYAGIADNTTLNFTVGNNAPVANADSATTNEDTGVPVDVLANDTDVDSSLNAASTAIGTAPTNGTTSINTANGVITYTPNANFNGSDSFTYTVADIHGATSAPATVTITINAVNDAPVAVNDMATTNEDTLVSIDVAANDTDVDTGDSVNTATINIVSAATNGTAVVNAGQVDYTPNANFSGSDSFTYTIEDQNGATSNTATVVVNVTGVNDLPTAVADSATVNEDEDVDIDVLANDSDLDGTLDGTTVQVMAAPANGSTFVDALTGVITYTPNTDYNGSDSFTYVVQDNSGGTSNAATVNITITAVNDAPVAANDTAIVLEDASHEVNVLGNDSDVDGTLVPGSVEVVTAATSGSTSVNATTGAITYTPNANFSGTDTFTYRVQDNLGLWSTPATVTMTVNNVNDAPVATDDTATTEEETAVIINLVTNDTDIDDGLNNASVVIVSTASNGSLVNNNNGTVTYTPDTAYIGSDSFSYTVADNSAAVSNVATVSITVTPGNIAPVISGSPATTGMVGNAYSFTPTASDADTGDTLTFSITGQPAWLNFSPTTGALSGTPADANVGTTGSIVISVSDGEESASLAAFTINVAEGVDTDGDTISDYQEGLDQTDPLDPTSYFDITPPDFVAPADVTLDAFALYTPVHLKQLLGLPLSASDTEVQTALGQLASDNVDGNACCDPEVENILLGSVVLLPPSRNEVTWLAEDFMGNISEVTQIVNVRPLVSMSKDQTTVEGNTVTISVILNGQSPFYPFTVPFVIDSSSTANSSDHNLVDGTVTFTETNGVGQTRATISVNLVADAMSEGTETLIVRLDDRTSHAEDLANGYDPDNPDIYDINSGAHTRHTIRIVEGNLVPDVSLQLQQNGMSTVLVATNGGPVTVTAQVTDPNPGDTQSYDWSATDNSLVDTDGNAQNATLVFNPSGLNPGRYAVRLAVTDSQGAIGHSRLFFRVLANLPTLDSATDTDEDGVDDQSEGTSDTDDDGIPDYLDNISESNVIPEQARTTRSFLMECDPGVLCRLGQFALLGETGGTHLEESDLAGQEDLVPDVDFDPVGGIFDFEIRELPEAGQSVRIVIPQRAAIPADAVYRKFRNGAWHTFVENADNALHSTAGNEGYCPPPGDEAWQPGLVAGHLCVQLTIEDGGPNDADGAVNGSVEDPGAVSVYQPSFVSHNVRSTGGGSVGLSLAIFFGLVWLAQLAVNTRKQQLGRVSQTNATKNKSSHKFTALAPLLLASTLLTQTEFSQADVSQQSLRERSSIELAVYQTDSSQSEGEFVNAMAADGVTVTIQRYDTSRTAWQLAYGYRVHERITLQVGYLDLGDVSIDFAAQAADDATIETALAAHYPAHADGWTVGYRFQHDFANNFYLSLDTALYLWRGEIDVSGAPISPENDGGLDPLLGLGINYRLFDHLSLGIEFQRVFLDREDVDLLGAQIGWQF